MQCVTPYCYIRYLNKKLERASFCINVTLMLLPRDTLQLLQQTVYILWHSVLCSLDAGIQSDDAGTLQCLKPGTYDSLAEMKLIVQGMTTCWSFAKHVTELELLLLYCVYCN